MRDLPDGCVGLYDDGRDLFGASAMKPGVEYLALPAASFHALVDKASRVEGLEREVAALKGVLGDARDIVAANPTRTQSGGWVAWPILARIDALLDASGVHKKGGAR